MNLQDILNSIQVGKIIKKPRKETEIIRVDENGFYYRIGENNKKKVTFEEIESAFMELNKNGLISRDWYRKEFDKISRSNPCNYTTIGSLLADLGASEYNKGKYYVIKK